MKFVAKKLISLQLQKPPQLFIPKNSESRKNIRILIKPLNMNRPHISLEHT